MSWLEKLKEYAPVVAGSILIGGTAALPAALLGILGKELLGNDRASPQRVEEQLRAYTELAPLDPEIARQLQRADLEFRSLQLELTYQDRKGARDRDVLIQQKRGNNGRADWMVLLAFAGFLCCLCSVVFLFFRGNPNAGLVGILATFGTKFLSMIDLTFAFEFGGSADGTEANKNIANLLGRQVQKNG